MMGGGIRQDAFWSALEAGISAVLSIAASFVIARLVGPAELGIGAAVTAVHVVLWVAVNGLFADALVQLVGLDDRTASSAYWASGLVGCGAMLLQFLAGCGLQAVLHDQRLPSMALLLAAPLPLVGAAGVMQGMMTRERGYRRLALRTLIGQGLGTTIGLGAALTGAGAWAVVCQQAVTSACGALTLLVNQVWRPSRRLDRTVIRSLLSVGLPLTASTLVSVGRYRLFAILVGGAAGPAVLGHVHIAFRLVDTVRSLAFTALWRLMLPAFARLQDNRLAMLRQVDLWLRRCVLLILPLCGVLAVTLAGIAGPALGPAWAADGQAALPLVALMAWSTVTFPAGVALVALGLVRYTLYANLISLACAAVAVLLLPPATPQQAIMIWSLSQLLVTPYTMWVNARALRVGILRPVTGGLGNRA